MDERFLSDLNILYFVIVSMVVIWLDYIFCMLLLLTNIPFK